MRAKTPQDDRAALAVWCKLSQRRVQMLQVVRMLKTHVTQAERHERGALLSLPQEMAHELVAAGLAEAVDLAEETAQKAAVPDAGDAKPARQRSAKVTS